MSIRSRVAPGGTHTAGTLHDSGIAKTAFRADQKLFREAGSGFGSVLGCRSAQDAKPIAPLEKRWLTKSSSSRARRFGKAINE
jgi:hypothetical protein